MAFLIFISSLENSLKINVLCLMCGSTFRNQDIQWTQSNSHFMHCSTFRNNYLTSGIKNILPSHWKEIWQCLSIHNQCKQNKVNVRTYSNKGFSNPWTLANLRMRSIKFHIVHIHTSTPKKIKLLQQNHKNRRKNRILNWVLKHGYIFLTAVFCISSLIWKPRIFNSTACSFQRQSSR